MSLEGSELEAMAEDELARACTLSWRDLSRVTPWGDSFEGFAPSGAPVEVERNYLWADRPGGDVLVEVTVVRNQVLYDKGARRSRLIPAPR
jgi:hypothetical protein